MRVFTILFILLLNFSHARSQTAASTGIQFMANDWELAQTAAKSEDKIIFIDIYTTSCDPCKQMDKYVFSKAEVGERFNGSFINVKIDAESELGKTIAEQYGVRSHPTYVFATAGGEMIYKVKGAMTPTQLIGEATKARSLARDYRPLEVLAAEYKTGERNGPLLYEYLRQKFAKEGRQPELLEEYLAIVPKAEERTEKILAIITKNIASVNSKGFKILTSSLEDFARLSDRQREIVIAGITIAKKFTFKKAVETNDEKLFERLIEAVYATSYSKSGAVAEEKQFRFDYAKITRNFPKFQLLAEKEGDYLLNKTTEELATETKQTIDNFSLQAQAEKLPEDSQQYKTVLKELQYGAEKSTSYQLNELAWAYFIMTDAQSDLQRALRWAERSLTLYTSPANLQTKAHLLYQLGGRRKAIKTAKKGIKLDKYLGNSSSPLQSSLTKMRKRLSLKKEG